MHIFITRGLILMYSRLVLHVQSVPIVLKHFASMFGAAKLQIIILNMKKLISSCRFPYFISTSQRMKFPSGPSILTFSIRFIPHYLSPFLAEYTLVLNTISSFHCVLCFNCVFLALFYCQEHWHIMLVIYFPKSQFSSRYGHQFYTLEISAAETKKDDFVCFLDCGEYTEYIITLRQGANKWTTNHRYSEFVKLHSVVQKEVTEKRYPIEIPDLPKKTLYRVTKDEDFINERRIALESYLDKILLALNAKGLMLPLSIADFLHINPTV